MVATATPDVFERFIQDIPDVDSWIGGPDTDLNRVVDESEDDGRLDSLQPYECGMWAFNSETQKRFIEYREGLASVKE